MPRYGLLGGSDINPVCADCPSRRIHCLSLFLHLKQLAEGKLLLLWEGVSYGLWDVSGPRIVALCVNAGKSHLL